MVIRSSAELKEDGWYRSVIETDDETAESSEKLINHLVTLMVAADITPEELTERYNEALTGTMEEPEE